MEYTENYNYNKPSATDVINAASRVAYNDNLDEIDGQIKELSDAVEAVSYDYVKLKGSMTISGILWNYRKWDSGYIELWCENVTLNFGASSASNTMHRAICTLNMSSICDKLYSVNVSTPTGIMTGSVNATTTTNAEIIRWTSTSETAMTANYININITGHYT